MNTRYNLSFFEILGEKLELALINYKSRYFIIFYFYDQTTLPA